MGRLEKIKTTPDYAVPALDSGLDILEALAACPVPQSLTSLAKLMNRVPGQLFRLLNRLEERTYITRDPVSGRYSLSLKLFELAHTHSPVEHILRVAPKFMRELAQRVNESIHLSVLNNGRLVVLIDEGSPARVRFSHEVGAQFPPTRTNSGRLLLAYLSPELRVEHLERDPEFNTLNDAQRLTFQQRLNRIRRKGYAIADSEERAGIKDIAVPLGNPRIGSTAALAIACLAAGRSKTDIQQLTKELHGCAIEISNDLGLTHESIAIL